jgi:hypothetical protein
MLLLLLGTHSPWCRHTLLPVIHTRLLRPSRIILLLLLLCAALC